MDAPKVPEPTPGKFVWFGRFKNRAGIITSVWKDGETLKIEIEPVPKGRKKRRTRNLLPYRMMDAEDTAKFKQIYDDETRKIREKKRNDKSAALVVLRRFDVERLGLVPRQISARYIKKKRVPKANGKGTTEVRVYSPRQVALRESKKKKRLQKLSSKIKKLMGEVKRELTAQDPKTRLTALAIALINETYERVGNATSAAGENSDSDSTPHLGVTVWTKRNIRFKGGKATIKYRGKSSVDHVKVVEDSATVKALRKACQDTKKANDCIFHYEDGEQSGTVTAQQVNERLREFGDITSKDLRGWHANRIMKEELAKVRKGELPTEKKERLKQLKQEFKEALEATAAQIQHEPSTLRNQYLVPSLEEQYLKNGEVIARLDH